MIIKLILIIHTVSTQIYGGGHALLLNDLEYSMAYRCDVGGMVLTDFWETSKATT